MNYKEFKERAKNTGAHKCLHFNWSGKIKDSCNRFDENRFEPCLLLKCKECEVYNAENTDNS